MFWEIGFSLPHAQKSKIQKIRNAETFLIFRCRYLPGIRLRKTTSRDLDYASGKHDETRYKLGKADFPLSDSGQITCSDYAKFRIFEATEQAKQQSIWDPENLGQNWGRMNDFQITILIGAQPVLESYDVIWCAGHSVWRLHTECKKKTSPPKNCRHRK